MWGVRVAECGLRLADLIQHTKQSFGVPWGSLSDLCWVYKRQNFKRVVTLRVLAFLTVPRGAFKSIEQVGLRNIVDIRPGTKCISFETFSVIPLKRAFVGVKPCFHCLDHEMELIV